MADTADRVEDEEILYRSVRLEEITVENGQMTWISSQAFADRAQEVSLDRAKLRPAEAARRRASDAVIGLYARDIRAITSVVHGVTSHRLDVRPDPILADPELPDNPAHAVIFGIPALERKGFDKLKQALKGIAFLVLPPAG